MQGGRWSILLCMHLNASLPDLLTLSENEVELELAQFFAIHFQFQTMCLMLPFDNPSAEMEWHEWQCVLKYTEMGTIEFNLMLLERCRL